MVDDHTCIFHYKVADASRISTMCDTQYGGVFSKKAYEEYGEDYGTAPDKIVSSGPYVVTGWEDNVSVTFEARDDYYGDTCLLYTSHMEQAVREGADPLRVLKMVTIHPARVLGLQDRLGSIEVNKDANFAVFKGLPGTDMGARVVYTIGEGDIRCV